MEAIFYDDAVELLGVTPGTLYHAVTRKVLTRLPRKGQKQCLIKEQVLLFKGKRLSLAALSPQERKKWQEYAALAGQGQADHQGQAIPAAQRDDIKALVQAEVSEQTAQLEDAFANFLLLLGTQFKDTVRPALKEVSRQQNREVPQGIPFLVTR